LVGEAMQDILKTVKTMAFSLFIGWILLFPIIFIIRDGLGPDSGPKSQGILALRRSFGTLWWGPVTAFLFLLSIFLHKISRGKD
jgi:hypothetical protein